MKMIHIAIALSMVSVLSLGISSVAMAADSAYYTAGQTKVVNAASECSHKWKEAADQAA